MLLSSEKAYPKGNIEFFKNSGNHFSIRKIPSVNFPHSISDIRLQF